MSEPGEISEFGYIMELLARGKVSGAARSAAAWVPTSGTTWRVAVGAPLHFRAGAGIPVRALSPGVPAATECKVGAFSLLRGISEMSQLELCGALGASWATGEAPGMARGERSACVQGEKGRAWAKGTNLEAPRAARAW